MFIDCLFCHITSEMCSIYERQGTSLYLRGLLLAHRVVKLSVHFSKARQHGLEKYI